MRGSKAALLGLTALAGCSLAPRYTAPQVTTPAAYKEDVPGWKQAAATRAPAGKWWELFDDPVLNGLEERIEAGNLDLAAATARYARARGQLGQARADLFPEIGIGGDISRNRLSGSRPIGPGAPITYNDRRVGASLAYELDLFGRIRNSVSANAANVAASGADIAAVRLGVQAALATNYFRMRGLDSRTALLRETVSAFQRAFDLTSTRHKGGIASGIDESRAQAQLASARSELSAVAAERAAYEHAIAVLVGDTPAALTIAPIAKLPEPPPVPAGTPSTLLERRPDIAAAERRVAAANARIGVARAAFFPSITVGAQGGYEATGGNLLSASNSFWALGPLSAALAIFDGGARRAGVRIARADYDAIVADYRQTVLVAFREVEDDLSASRNLIVQERDQRDAARASERTRDLALTRYRDGASDYLEVVTAQNAALDAQRGLLEVRTRQLEVAVDMFRALGGSY